MEKRANLREIEPGATFGDMAVEVNGVRVEVHGDGSIDAYTKGQVNVHSAALENRASRPSASKPRVGNTMPDGTVFAGVSTTTRKPMYVPPEDALLTYSFNQAQEYAHKLDAHGHNDWRVPTKAELSILYRNAALIGGFNETGVAPTSWYWSSTKSIISAWGQRFSDGTKDYFGKAAQLSLRCVRD